MGLATALKNKVLFFVFFLIGAVLTAAPFQHDLDLQVIPGAGTPTLCLHGYGGSGKMLLKFLKKHHATDGTLIAFNFPDYDIQKNPFEAHLTKFGTIDELLPVLYLMKKCVVDGGVPALNLYGFSAGGGAVINSLAVLNSSNDDDPALLSIGIDSQEKKAILEAVQRGAILLDCPLKSMEEIIDLRGETQEFLIVAKRYRENELRPIDSIKKLKNLSLNLFVFFQTPDATISNRDDHLFLEELKKANTLGRTHVLFADQGDHNTFHSLLWDTYTKTSSNTH